MMIVNELLSNRLLRSGLALSAVLACTIGCGETGEVGVLRLVELDGNQDGSLSPIAEGTDVRYRVGRSSNVGNGVPLESFSSSDKTVFSVESEDQRELLIHGEKSGTATLSVEADGGDSDTFALEVRPIANVFYTFRSQTGTIWKEHGGALATSKLNLVPDAPINAEFRYYVGPNGERLSGAGTTIAFGTPEKEGWATGTLRANGFDWIFTPGADASRWSVETPFGDPLKLRAKAAVEVASLQVFSGAWLRNGQLPMEGRTILAPQGSTVSLTFQLVDEDGYTYIGAYDADATVSFGAAEDFNPRLNSELSTSGGKNQCKTETATGCSAWEKLERVSFQMKVPDRDAETTINIGVGEFSETYTLKAVAKTP